MIIVVIGYWISLVHVTSHLMEVECNVVGYTT